MTSVGLLKDRKDKIVVIGMGYVGLPLMIKLNEHFFVYGFDNDLERIESLKKGFDVTRTIGKKELSELEERFSSDTEVIGLGDVIIVAVPTPINLDLTPNLEPLKQVAVTISKNLKKGALVVLESTVYPGVTEQVFGSIIARRSGLKLGNNFHLGYAPERINPGDSHHTIEKITKVVAGEESRVTELMASIYGMVTGGNIYRAIDIRTAELAKILENTQRDLNIALMNELSMICDRIGIDTREVIDTASTKWNFSRFEPGLVGGHCIGVDPYYLTYIAEKVGHFPHVVLAGRRVNSSMGRYVANRLMDFVSDQGVDVEQAKVLVMGYTFKENVTDSRNTKVEDIVRTIADHGMKCDVYDPEAVVDDCLKDRYNFVTDCRETAPYDAIVIAVKHDLFRSQFSLSSLRNLCQKDCAVMIDVKAMFEAAQAEAEGFSYWCL